MNEKIEIPRFLESPAFYHFFVFGEIIDRCHKELVTIHNQKRIEIRKKFLSNLLKTGSQVEIEDWDKFFKYLVHLEEIISKIVSRKPKLFWIHMYRRWGIYLADYGDDYARQPMTIRLVRRTVDTLIQKHGQLENDGSLIDSSTAIRSEVLGGMYETSMLEYFSEERVDEIFQKLSSRSQWIIGPFSDLDYLNLSFVESLSYEYCKTTALMRSIGKNISLIADSESLWFKIDESLDSLELQMLTLNIDNRNENRRYSSVSFGFWIPVSGKISIDKGMVPIPQINVEHKPLSYLVESEEYSEFSDMFSANFDVVPFDLKGYCKSAEFASNKLLEKLGFSIRSVEFGVRALCAIAIIPKDNERGEGENFENLSELEVLPSLINLAMRGGVTVGFTYDDILAAAKYFANEGGETRWNILEKEIKIFLDYITDHQSLADQIAIWSGGRRCVIYEFEGTLFLDISAIDEVLQTIFFGVRGVANERGGEFESVFRECIESKSGKHQTFFGELKSNSKKKRELDIGILIDDRLIVFECVSMERPLDYEIGKPKTMEKRRIELDKKLNQAKTMSEFLINNPVGRNYDFSRAVSIEHYVVSPLTEWIPSFDERYWDTAGRPRILSADEAVELVESASA